MSIIIPANTLAAGGFDVDNSLRINQGDSAYLHKTFGTSSDRKKWTYSFWIKKASQTDMGVIAQGADGNNKGLAYFNAAGDFVYFEAASGSVVFLIQTNDLYRDNLAWYHFVIRVDTTQGTAANRVRLYVNGTQITTFQNASYPDQNYQGEINKSDTRHDISGFNAFGENGYYFDGYMAEVVFTDGQSLAPTDFGEFDEDSNIWKPIKVSGLTFGTNGFYLDFKASGNLGNDANGGTDLTEVNLAATDQSTDTCTNNFATWNSLNQQSSISYSEGNTTFINSSGGNRMAFSNFGVTAGKWYAELKVGVVHNHMRLGVADISFYIPVTNAYSTNLPNSISYANDNPIYIGGSSQGDFGSFTTDDIISIVMDMDNGFVYFAKNGTYLNSGDPTSGSDGTGGFAIPNYTTKTYCFLGSSYDGGTDATVLANFGSPSYSESGGETDGNGYGNFAHAVPSGYFSLNTKNLAENG